jgi:hypothetical protein
MFAPVTADVTAPGPYRSIQCRVFLVSLRLDTASQHSAGHCVDTIRRNKQPQFDNSLQIVRAADFAARGGKDQMRGSGEAK